MTEKLKIGNLGEKAAADFLASSGYKILETNWRFEHKEIDIIALRDQKIIVIEVKTRKQNSLIEPEEAVNEKKQTHLIDAAEAYLNQSSLDYEVRFDIISVFHNGEKVIHLKHIEDAFISEF